MKSKKILIISLIVLIVISFSVCMLVYLFNEKKDSNKFNQDNDNNTFYRKIGQIILENPKCNSKEKVIYEYPDGRKIRSRCGEVYYKDDDSHKLSDALNSSIISIEDISKKMNVILGVYDGGTIVYEYKLGEDNFSNGSFRLEICKKINGSHDMLFLSKKSNNYICA